MYGMSLLGNATGSDCYVVAAYCVIEVLSYSAYGTTGCTPHEGYVKMNGSSVWEHGWCSDLASARGVSILVVDPVSCTARDSRTFDTSADSGAADDLKNYLDGLSGGNVIIGVTGEEPRELLDDALSTLDQFGVYVSDVQQRGSFAFIVQKDFEAKAMFDKVLTEEESDIAPAHLNATIIGNV